MAKARTTREGQVFLMDAALPEDVLEGTVEKTDGRWRSVCALDENHEFYMRTKTAAVAELDDHFIKDHTTLLS